MEIKPYKDDIDPKFHDVVETVLKKIPILSREILPVYEIEKLKFSVEEVASLHGRSLLFKLKTFIYGKERGDIEIPINISIKKAEEFKVEFSFPSSWWQFFKNTYRNKWPIKWFVKVFPVKFKTKSDFRTKIVTFNEVRKVKILRYDIYPEARFDHLERFDDISFPMYEYDNRWF